MKQTALCFVFRDSDLLMILKKRGQGAGKMNVPGGKLRDGESALQAAVRETFEETGITPGELREAGRLEFLFPENNNWANTCTVFTARAFTGSLVPENEECSALWVPVAEIPLAKMWSSDRIWLPLLLAGKPFHRRYIFNANDEVRDEIDLSLPGAG